ncbi:NAD(P)-binding protein [Rhizodiscina lignyota]|uniref:NAD(P)-binding protein n=1 Tax=Rhizodiscina lignyota TaxID=1504668 RepID=A0A9P4M5L4_9PEZI|nr:NAD(P)-binding protein [Rhizodiscina lignyota]
MAPTVLITGCTKGSMGYSLAKEFARRGWHVYATARKVESMEGLDAAGKVTLLSLDVTNHESLVAARDRVSSENGGKLDVLYHNAGRRSLVMAIDSDPKSDFDDDVALFKTNLFGIMDANRLFAPLLISAMGTVVLTGSVSGRIPQPSQAAYNASKAALEMYSKILRLELAPLSVKVVYTLTGGVQTHQSAQRVKFPPESLYRPIEKKMNDAWEKYERIGMDPDSYAKYVVGKVVQKHPPENIWAGYGSRITWFIETTGMQWIYDRMMKSDYGLDRPLR